LSLFNAHYDECGFQPTAVFGGEGRFVTALFQGLPIFSVDSRHR
jgi:hypothetical protein